MKDTSQPCKPERMPVSTRTPPAPPLTDLLRARRRAVDALPPAEQPAALAELAALVEDRGALPGVARALRLKALELARAHLPADAPLTAELEEISQTTCRPPSTPLGERGSPGEMGGGPDPASWRDRMAALARGKRRRRR